jgi:chromate transport protein ChrA
MWKTEHGVEGDRLVMALRFICMALIMIMVSLVLPDLRLGGRFLMLLEAIVIALLIHGFRKLIGNRIPDRERSILTGLSIVMVLFLVKILFPGVNLTIMGMLLLYCGAVVLEIILPDRITGGIWRNES